MAEPKMHSKAEIWTFWVYALTFAWGLVVTIGVKKLGWYQGAVLVYAYPLACVIAAVAVARSTTRSSRWLFAGVNSACALGWVALVVWATREFAKHFWR